jgi:hypothetical protein
MAEDSSIKEIIAERVSRYREITPVGFVIVVGLVLSFLATLNYTFDAISGISAQEQSCQQSSTYANSLNAKFITVLVISCVALTVGIILGFALKNNKNPMTIIVLGLAGTGIVGILYSLALKYATSVSIGWKLGLSWTALIIFVLAGIAFEITGGQPLQIILKED